MTRSLGLIVEVALLPEMFWTSGNFLLGKIRFHSDVVGKNNACRTEKIWCMEFSRFSTIGSLRFYVIIFSKAAHSAKSQIL